MTSQNFYTAYPKVKKLQGTVRLPGSKSLAARALILAVLHSGEVVLQGVPIGKDTQVMVEGLKSLGFKIEPLPSEFDTYSLKIEGLGGDIPLKKAHLDVYESGTAGRFLPALVALSQGGQYDFYGQSSFERRPMAPLIQALTSRGSVFCFQKLENHYPFSIVTQGLNGGTCQVDTTASSQFFSALLMVSGYAKKPLQLIQTGDLPSAPFIDLTLSLMKFFGYHYENGYVKLPQASNIMYTIEPDATAMSYFMALVTLLGGEIRIIDGNKIQWQKDQQFAQYLMPYGLILKAIGEDLILTSNGLQNPFKGEQIYNFQSISDTFITFAAMAPFLGHPVYLTGLAHTRLQESDRLQAVADQLIKMGQMVKVLPDGLYIEPMPVFSAQIDSCNDHRLAMAFGLLAHIPVLGEGQSWLSIKDPEVCDKTFPGYFNILNQITI